MNGRLDRVAEGLASMQGADKATIKTVLKESGVGFPSRAYAAAVWFLGLVAVFAVIGAMVLAFYAKEIPEVPLAIGSAAVGGLVGLLVPQERV